MILHIIFRQDDDGEEMGHNTEKLWELSRTGIWDKVPGLESEAGKYCCCVMNSIGNESDDDYYNNNNKGDAIQYNNNIRDND